jgi:hypothetical protein
VDVRPESQFGDGAQIGGIFTIRINGLDFIPMLRASYKRVAEGKTVEGANS